MEAEVDSREGHGHHEQRARSHHRRTKEISSALRSLHERQRRGEAERSVGHVSARERAAGSGMPQEAAGALSADDELEALHHQQPHGEHCQNPARIHDGASPAECDHDADSDQRGGEKGGRASEPDREGTRLVAAKLVDECCDVGILPFQAFKAPGQEEKAEEREQTESRWDIDSRGVARALRSDAQGVLRAFRLRQDDDGTAQGDEIHGLPGTIPRTARIRPLGTRMTLRFG